MDANIFPFYFWGDKVNHSSSPIQKKEDIFSGFLTFIFSLLPEAGILSFFYPSINSSLQKRVQMY
jgi:hypothetical protein